MNHRKHLSILLTICLIVGLLPCFALPALAWDDTDDLTISSADDWDAFADAVAGGDSFSGKTVRLAADVSVSTMVGTSDHPFRGAFNGGGHTLTVALTSSGEFTAPFRYVDGASIQALHTAGTVGVSSKYGSGLIGSCKGETTVRLCVSSVTVNSTVSGDGTHGGFIGVLESGGSATVTDCLFNGALNGSSTHSCGGFAGWANGSLSLRNDLFDPAGVTVSTNNSAVFARNGANVTNSYYTTAFGTTQGSDGSSMTADALAAALGGSWTVTDGKAVPSMEASNLATAEITGLESGYDWTGEAITLSFSVTAMDGTALTEGTHYTASLTKDGVAVETAQELGQYTLTLAAKDGGGYTGALTKQFTVGSTWSAVQSQLSEGGAVKLHSDVKAGSSDSCLDLAWDKTATLDLNGFVIDRGLTGGAGKEEGYVIECSGKLTLIDSRPDAAHTGDYASLPAGGVITGGYSTGYGGGGIRMNNSQSRLTMEGGTITGNAADGYGGGVYSNAGDVTVTGGAITGNTAGKAGGGIYFVDTYWSTYKLSVSGSPVITGNTSGAGDAKTADNVFLKNDQFDGKRYANYLYISGALTEGAHIGLSTSTTGETRLTSGWNSHMSGKDPAAYLSVDRDPAQYTLVVSDNEVVRRGNEHPVTIPAFTGGSVASDPDGAAGAGNTVTLTVTPDSGMYLSSLTVAPTAGGDALVLTQTGSKTYTFTMPDADLTVSAVFAEGALMNWYDVYDALTAGGTVQLTNDVTAPAGAPAPTVTKEAVLDLNGHTLDRGLSEPTTNGYVIVLRSGGILTIRDSSATEADPVGTGKLTGGWTRYGGGGVCVFENGALTLESGSITGNRVTSSVGVGGVYVGKNGTLTVRGGAITNNKAFNDGTWRAYGGGVYTAGPMTMSGGVISGNWSEGEGGGVYASSTNGSYDNTFILTGGTIKNNTSTYGNGGVEIYSSTTLKMTGGTITGNAYGVYLRSGAAEISGGTITGNSVGGVYVGFEDLRLSGSPLITDNGNDGDCDIYFIPSSNQLIQVTGPLTPGAAMVMKLNTTLSSNEAKTFTSGLNGNGKPSACFVHPSYAVLADENGEAMLKNVTSYRINYYLQNGKLPAGEGNPASYTADDAAFTLANPVRTGYDFVGWTECGPLNITEPTLSVTVPAGTTGDLYFYTAWTAHSYSVRFDGNGATSGSMADQSMTYDDATDARGDYLTANGFSRDGYVFIGWSTEADGTGEAYRDQQQVKNLSADNGAVVTLYAQWSGQTYNVSFDRNAPSGAAAIGNMPDQSFTFGEAAALNANAYRCSGYAFAGWNTAADGSGTPYADQASFSAAAYQSSVTLYAQWTLLAADAPIIIAEPADLTLPFGYAAGSTVSVSASTSADCVLSYQWYVGATDDTTAGTGISGATAASYAIPTGRSAWTEEYYYCVVTATRTDNAQKATTTSKAAKVAVTAKTLTDPTITLPATAFAYDGTAHTPAVTVRDGDTELTPVTDFIVTYRDNTEIGTATVVVTTVAGSSYDFAAKEVTFTIYGVKGTVSGETLTYSVVGAPDGNAQLIAAWYDDSGRLLGTESANVAAGDTPNATLAVGAGAALYRLMLVDKTSHAPLCKAWSIKE